MSLIPFEIYQGSKKRILLTGGTGFIGKRLIQILMYLKHDVTLLVRDINIARTKLSTEVNFITQFSEITDEAEFDVIINLAGEPLAKGRWTKQRKAIFINSRLNITAGICDLVKRLKHKPDVLINGSAIGYYGPHQDEVLDENGTVVHCFSHELCRKWEEQALKVEAQGIRVCLLRIGIVLGDDGGPLAELRLPFDYGFSMQISKGEQFMSWIHRDDLIAIIIHLFTQSKIHGVINGTAPNPVTNKVFADTLSLHLKTFLRIKFPAKLLSLLVGELADEVLITGQRVIPTNIQQDGFEFTYPELNTAFEDLIN
ncbi:TIGR01777 family oxidoreductase [Colwellia sp. UCD-KL20]|uniref:TIGR01777 family oxidoreductase n=1 Tax=Colwellia sp. UCD-KL20 TaxID=1917165 RepID=UPI0009707321|nr:TIGR01777 family oxidoreductase [Colwellia sp. UCD-KL20]